MARAGNELFQPQVTRAARVAGKGGISPKTEIFFPHESRILFFCHASAFIDHGKDNAAGIYEFVEVQ